MKCNGVDVYNLLVSQSHTSSLFLATVRRRRLQSYALVANILATAAGCCVFKFLRANSNKSPSENISFFCRLFSRLVRGCRSTASGPRIAPVAKSASSARRSRVEKVLEMSKITIRSLSLYERGFGDATRTSWLCRHYAFSVDFASDSSACLARLAFITIGSRNSGYSVAA